MSKIIKILSLSVVIHQSLLAGISLPNPFAKKKAPAPTEVNLPNTKKTEPLPIDKALNSVEKQRSQETTSETSEMGQSLDRASLDEDNVEADEASSIQEKVKAAPATAKRPFLVHRDGGVDTDEWEEQMSIVTLLEQRGELIRREAFLKPYKDTLYDMTVYTNIEKKLEKNTKMLTPMLAPFDIPSNFLSTLDNKNTKIADLLIERAFIEARNPDSSSPDHLNPSQIKVKFIENLNEIKAIQQSTQRSASGPLISVSPDEDIEHYKKIIKDAQVIDGETDFDDEGRAYTKDNKTGYKVTQDRSGKLTFTDVKTGEIIPRT